MTKNIRALQRNARLYRSAAKIELLRHHKTRDPYWYKKQEVIALADSLEQDELLVGQIFEGRFLILSVLGKGGGGVVYKAKHTHMDKLVAIKMLVSSVVHDELSFLRFEQEARAAAALEHTNIITIHDFGKTVDGRAYLVMEFLGGQSLDDILKSESRLNVDRFATVFSQVCDGLQHAHKKGVVHRDIKPSNIMIVEKSESICIAKVVDFGLAKLTAQDSAQHLTKTGMVMGTPLFMSPEQCRGAEIDYRSDVYSLGCVMYAALTGQVPLKGDSTLSTLYKHMAEAPPPFSVVAAELNLPTSLEAAIFKALNKDPDQRHQSMGELRNSISDAIYSWHHPNKPGESKNAAKLQEPSQQADATVVQALSQTMITAPRTVKMAANMPKAQTTIDQDQVSQKHSSVQVSKKQLPAIVSVLVASLAVLALCFGLFYRSHPGKVQTVNLKSSITAIATAADPSSKKNASTFTPSMVPATSTSSTATNSVPHFHEKESSTEIKLSENPQKITKSKTARTLKTKVKTLQPPITTLSRPTPHSVPRDSSTGVAHLPPPPAESQAINADRNQVLERAHALQRQANEAFNVGDTDMAMKLLAQCIAMETKVWGRGDPHLFRAKANVIGLLMRAHNISQLKPYLQEGLDMFSKRGQEIVPIGARTKDPSAIWRSMARSSKLVAFESQGRVAVLYSDWSADFYQLAISSWRGSTADAEFIRLKEEKAQVIAFNRNQNATITRALQTHSITQAPKSSQKPQPKHHAGRGIREY